MKIEARKGNPTPTGSSGILLKSILCLLFVLGIVMCVAGVNGMTTFGAPSVLVEGLSIAGK